MIFGPGGKEQLLEPRCGGLDTSRLISSPTASSPPAAVCRFAPSGCEEDAIGTEGKLKALWASPRHRQRSLQPGRSDEAEDAHRLNQLFFFFPPEKSPRIRKREQEYQNRQLFKLAPEVAEEGVASLVQPTAGSGDR